MSAFLIMIDGLRPDAIEPTHCPNLKALIARASYTPSAQSVMPSVTLPCHTSIFHSVPPTRHGVTTNTFQPMARPLPGLIDVAHAAGKRCCTFHNWEPLRDISRPEALYASFYTNTSYQADGDSFVAEAAAREIPRLKPDFAFIYLGTVDTAGHAHGWMNDGYLRQIETVDVELGRVLAALPADAHIVLQADHGGHDRGHGTDCAEDMTIPWLAAGPSIKLGHTLAQPVSLLDTAPTLARMLGVAAHPHWEGRAVDEAFAAEGG
jgi:predicted AlkP superfamily pyrophosphatase or phosphodiesterase